MLVVNIEEDIQDLKQKKLTKAKPEVITFLWFDVPSVSPLLLCAHRIGVINNLFSLSSLISVFWPDIKKASIRGVVEAIPVHFPVFVYLLV